MAKTFLDGANLNFNQREGSGAAFVLPENQAVAQYVGMMDQKRQQEMLNQQAAIKKREAFNERIDDNISKLSPGAYSQQFGKGIQEGYNEVIGLAKTMQKNGIDPFTNPEFLQKRNGLVNQAAASKELSTQYTNFVKEYGKDPDAYDNGTEILAAYQSPDALEKFMSGEFNPGQLQKRYSVADAVKASGAKPVTVETNDGYKSSVVANRAQHMTQALTTLDMPEAQYVIKKNGGDPGSPYRNGFPVSSKDGSPEWPTDKKDIEVYAIDQLEGDPQFMDFLSTKGYDTSTAAKAIESAVDYMQRQNSAIGGYVKEFADKLSGNVNEKFKAEFEGRRFALSQRADARSSESHSLTVQDKKLDIAKKQKGLAGDAEGQKYGDVLTDAVMSGNKEALEDLARSYGTKGQVKVKGDNLEIENQSGDKQLIALKDKERIKKVIREAMPDGQYKAEVNGDVYKGPSAKDGRLKTDMSGLLPKTELLDDDALADNLLKKFSK